VLAACERLVADRSEVEVLAARERILAEDDADGHPHAAAGLPD
jgi:hypothetical protein